MLLHLLLYYIQDSFCLRPSTHIPVILVVVHEVHQGSRQRLIHNFIKTIELRVVHRTDPVVRATQLKQFLVNPVDEFSALVGHHNFRHSVSGDQVVQEIRHTQRTDKYLSIRASQVYAKLELDSSKHKKSYQYLVTLLHFAKKQFWLRQNCCEFLIFVTGYTQGK